MLFRNRPRAPSALDDEQVRTRLVAFVCDRSPLAGTIGVDVETRLFSSGLLDSLGFVDLVAFIERELGVALGERAHVDMHVLDRLGDIVALVSLVSRPG